MTISKLKNYFTKTELILICSSLAAIIGSFLIFDRENYLTLIASVIGIFALILCAKGNPLGQVLIIIFSSMYGIISFFCKYYGEVLTYVGMTAPMAVLSLISWLKNPYKKGEAEVKTAKIKKKDVYQLAVLTPIISVIFFFTLKYFGTENLTISTVSVTTSFAAVFLTYKRSKYFTLAYALNDLVLIALWTLAAIKNISYLSVIICFCAFLAHDIYGFISWRRMEIKQSGSEVSP